MSDEHGAAEEFTQAAANLTAALENVCDLAKALNKRILAEADGQPVTQSEIEAGKQELDDAKEAYDDAYEHYLKAHEAAHLAA